RPPPARTSQQLPTMGSRPPGVIGTPVPRSSPALDTQAPPTTMLDSSDLSLADGTSNAVKPSSSRRGVVIAATAIAVVLAAGIVFAMSRSGETPPNDPATAVARANEDPKAAVDQSTKPPEPKIEPKVEHIDHVDDDQIEMP